MSDLLGGLDFTLGADFAVPGASPVSDPSAPAVSPNPIAPPTLSDPTIDKPVEDTTSPAADLAQTNVANFFSDTLTSPEQTDPSTNPFSAEQLTLTNQNPDTSSVTEQTSFTEQATSPTDTVSDPSYSDFPVTDTPAQATPDGSSTSLQDPAQEILSPNIDTTEQSQTFDNPVKSTELPETTQGSSTSEPVSDPTSESTPVSENIVTVIQSDSSDKADNASLITTVSYGIVDTEIPTQEVPIQNDITGTIAKILGEPSASFLEGPSIVYSEEPSILTPADSSYNNNFTDKVVTALGFYPVDIPAQAPGSDDSIVSPIMPGITPSNNADTSEPPIIQYVENSNVNPLPVPEQDGSTPKEANIIQAAFSPDSAYNENEKASQMIEGPSDTDSTVTNYGTQVKLTREESISSNPVVNESDLSTGAAPLKVDDGSASVLFSNNPATFMPSSQPSGTEFSPAPPAQNSPASVLSGAEGVASLNRSGNFPSQQSVAAGASNAPSFGIPSVKGSNRTGGGGNRSGSGNGQQGGSGNQNPGGNKERDQKR